MWYLVDGVSSHYHHDRHCFVYEGEGSVLEFSGQDAFRVHVCQLLDLLQEANKTRAIYLLSTSAFTGCFRKNSVCFYVKH